jgi:GLPGLI family protein
MKTSTLMKKLVLILGIIVSLTAFNVVFGQTGTIEYEVKMNMHRTLPPGREEMKAMIPEFRTSKQQLFFNENESLYKPIIEDDDEEIEGSSGGGGFRMVVRQPNNEVYINQSTGKNVSKEEFFGKTYLIQDSLKVTPWKFGTEVKTIQGYDCQQAYYTDESDPKRKREITAWYTTKLRPFLGPDRFNTLPGAVLAIDINNGERVILAKKIELKPLKKNDIKEPKSGENLSRAEFKKVQEEQFKKMNTGGGGMIIRN